MNTVSTASMSRPYRPAPTPPGTTSPSIMSNSTMPPPNAVNESWNEFTAPVEVTVVDPANRDDPGMPNRTSLPSIAPCAACRAVPACCHSKKEMPPTATSHSPAITATRT